MRQRWKKEGKLEKGGQKRRKQGKKKEDNRVLNKCLKVEDTERANRFVKDPFYFRIENKINKNQGHMDTMLTKLQNLKIKCG